MDIILTQYNDQSFSETSISDIRDLSLLQNKEFTYWVDIKGKMDESLLKDLRQVLEIHALAINYISNKSQSPRFEIFDNFQLLISNSMLLEDKVRAAPISLIIKENMIVSIQNETDLFEDIRAKLRSGETRSHTIDHLSFSIIDTIISTYYPVIETLGMVLGKLEGNIVSGKSLGNEIGVEIHQINRKLLFMYQTIWNQNEALNDFIRYGLVDTSQDILYLRKSCDYAKELMEMVDIYRDVSHNLMDVYLSSVSNKFNSVMKILSICVSIFAPMTVITGLYGMNFDNIPGLHEWWGFPLSLLLMVASSGGLLVLFKKVGIIGKSS